jgi:hypothetical protein
MDEDEQQRDDVGVACVGLWVRFELGEDPERADAVARWRPGWEPSTPP